MADLNKLVDELSALTVLEAAELSKLLEEKWGVSAAAPVAVAAAAPGAAAAPAEEKTEFDVIDLLDRILLFGGQVHSLKEGKSTRSTAMWAHGRLRLGMSLTHSHRTNSHNSNQKRTT